MIRFRVERVFAVRSKGLTAVAVGRLLDGELALPVVLQDTVTAARVRVRGIDQVVAARDPELTALQIDERSPAVPEAGAVLTGPPETVRDDCDCVTPPRARADRRRRRVPRFHAERQDITAPGWLRLVELIEQARAEGWTVFNPYYELTQQEKDQIVTLPAAIGTLTQVEELKVLGLNLVRIPPQIGRMTSLVALDNYMSYRLHWYPYELTRCSNLLRSTISIRALYGNYKFRPHFPRLLPPRRPDPELDPGVWGADQITTCSVCDGPIPGEVHQVWISLKIVNDVLPLLVNACSAECVAALPAPAANYPPAVHTGGSEVHQPEPSWGW